MANRDTVEEFWDFLVLEECISSSESGAVDAFLERFDRFLGGKGKMWLFPRATIALEVFLQTTRSSARRNVLVSSFNCPNVADAVIAAGLNVDTFDLADERGTIDWSGVSNYLSEQHLAVVIPHLFGVPTDFRPLLNRARALGVLVIEDCAHTLGGKIDGQMAGLLGDAAIFSFNYDKPISLGGGGLLLVNTPELAGQLRFRRIPSDKDVEIRELETFREYLSQRRWLIDKRYGLKRLALRVAAKSRLFQERSIGNCQALGPIRATLGIWQLQRYERVKEVRNRNAAVIGNLGLPSWGVAESVIPAWLRQKVILPTAAHLSMVSKQLQRAGIAAGAFNWPTTIDIHLGRPALPISGDLCGRALDIPTHQAMHSGDLERVMRALERV